MHQRKGEEMTPQSNSDKTFGEKIAIRNNWLKIFVVVVATVVLGTKFWQADFSQAYANLNFSDLLALFLALFSIALSVLFYLKATETSNVFYDNTYRFTKDVSEILGRVEAGFGEKLAHLDEGYSGLKSAVEKIPFDRKQTEKDIEEEEKQLHKVEKEREEIIENLAERARLEGKEKEKLFERLKEQDNELTKAKRELHVLRRRMMRAERRPRMDGSISVPRPLRRYLKRTVLREIPNELLFDAPMDVLNRHLKEITRRVGPDELATDLRNYHVIDEDGDLTQGGRALLREIEVEEDS